MYYFLQKLLFILQWLSFHWENLIILSQFPLTFHLRGCPILSHSLWQTGSCWKKVFEDIKLAYANKTKESITSWKSSSQYFWQIANNALNRDKSFLPLLLNYPEVSSCASDKAKLFAKNFYKNSCKNLVMLMR